MDDKSKFDSYYDAIASGMDSGQPVSERNHDRIHNAALIKLMLDRGGTVNMFCGCMSIFTNDFYSDIARDYSTDEADYVKRKVTDSLVKFLSKETNRLNVVLERKVEGLLHNAISGYTAAKRAIESGTLNLSYLGDDILWKEQLYHFCYSESTPMIRVETDKVMHQGVFVGNDPKPIKPAKTCFDGLKDLAIPLS